MSGEKKKELVCTILSQVHDPDIRDFNVQAEFKRLPNESNGAKGKFDFKDIYILLLIFRSPP